MDIVDSSSQRALQLAENVATTALKATAHGDVQQTERARITSATAVQIEQFRLQQTAQIMDLVKTVVQKAGASPDEANSAAAKAVPPARVAMRSSPTQTDGQSSTTTFSGDVAVSPPLPLPPAQPRVLPKRARSQESTPQSEPQQKGPKKPLPQEQAERQEEPMNIGPESTIGGKRKLTLNVVPQGTQSEKTQRRNERDPDGSADRVRNADAASTKVATPNPRPHAISETVILQPIKATNEPDPPSSANASGASTVTRRFVSADGTTIFGNPEGLTLPAATNKPVAASKEATEQQMAASARGASGSTRRSRAKRTANEGADVSGLGRVIELRTGANEVDTRPNPAKLRKIDDEAADEATIALETTRAGTRRRQAKKSAASAARKQTQLKTPASITKPISKDRRTHATQKTDIAMSR
jgi:hypothetical protein